MTLRIATCACGQLQARCAGDPELVAACHCSACRRRTGSAFGIAAFFPRGSVETIGDARIFTRPSESGFAVAFHFCPTCGTSVFWEPARRPEFIAVAAGAFADSSFPAPTREVYTEGRCRWITLEIKDHPKP